ncbi:MAG: hypothetical protein K0R94_561, partial [Burkholderiales bacterium]|nr:hypothetical protein [Burkholderiales bacterium]
MKQINISDIKKRLDILQVATHYGVDVKKAGSIYRAKHNPLREEKTSSLYFYSNSNSFYDFGSGRGGDCITLIKEIKRCDTKNAIQIAQAILSGSESETRNYPPVMRLDTTYVLTNLEKQFNGFEALTFANDEHKPEILDIAPIWLIKQAHKADLDLFKALTRFDPINKTLVCACLDNSSGLFVNFVGYKRRRYNSGKWVNAKGTKANCMAFIRVFSDEEPIYVIEGYHDLLVA